MSFVIHCEIFVFLERAAVKQDFLPVLSVPVAPNKNTPINNNILDIIITHLDTMLSFTNLPIPLPSDVTILLLDLMPQPQTTTRTSASPTMASGMVIHKLSLVSSMMEPMFRIQAAMHTATTKAWGMTLVIAAEVLLLFRRRKPVKDNPTLTVKLVVDR